MFASVHLNNEVKDFFCVTDLNSNGLAKSLMFLCSVQRRWCALVVSTVYWKLPWIWYSLSWLPCTSFFVGVQVWCRWSRLRILNTLCLNLPHTVLRCTTQFVPNLCLLPPPSVCSPFSSLFVFLVGSSLKWRWKRLDFFVYRCWLRESVDCCPCISRDSFVVVLVKDERQGSVFSSPRCCLHSGDHFTICSVMIFMDSVVGCPIILSHYDCLRCFLAGCAGCRRKHLLLLLFRI